MSGPVFDPVDVELIDNVDQLKAVLDRKRICILRMLGARQLTVKQIADEMMQAPASIHYHVKVLEKAGLVRIVEKRESARTVEKFYRATARDYELDPAMGESDDTPSLALDAVARDIQRAVVQMSSGPLISRVVNAQLINVRLSSEEASRFVSELEDLASEFEIADDAFSSTRYSLAMAIYPTDADSPLSSASSELHNEADCPDDTGEKTAARQDQLGKRADSVRRRG